MRSALIGYTGFIGGNLLRQATFDACYNSKNIAEIRNRSFDLVVCGGVTAVKWWANQNAIEDRKRIDSLLADLSTVRAAKVIVLSTVDVYPVSAGADETFDCHSLPNHAYGTNRLYLEDALRERFSDVTLVRISGVFGPGLKKNVIYDLIHDNCLDVINPDSSFQYYNVENLWRDLQVILHGGIRLINFVNEPLRTGDIIEAFFPGKAVGHKPAPTARYDLHTLHSALFGGPPHYLLSAPDIHRELGAFLTSVQAGVHS